jgi:hypothetical protein
MVAGAAVGEAPTHYYSVKHATSDDGMVWQTDDRLCLPYLDNEHAIARPVVTAIDGGYRMIYSARPLGETYRIYSAISADGLSWQRNSRPMIDVAASGWDSEMVCYGSRLDCRGGNFLLYNGNAYGKDGFGAARKKVVLWWFIVCPACRQDIRKPRRTYNSTWSGLLRQPLLSCMHEGIRRPLELVESYASTASERIEPQRRTFVIQNQDRTCCRHSLDCAAVTWYRIACSDKADRSR